MSFVYGILFLYRLNAWEDSCSPFHEIYSDGQELCEKMWEGAFTVVDDSQDAYTMWFFDESNSNNEVTDAIWGAGTAANITECHLQYYHKDAPTPEDENFTECHPWKENACCHQNTVKNVETIRESYGEGYEWDRCGPMSQACERFFVQEACFYECDPNAGLYRKWNSTSLNHSEYNEWQMEGMPIKRSFCNAWYTACYNDYFCGTGGFFECNTDYWATINSTGNTTVIFEKVGSAYPWTLVIILIVVAVLVLCLIMYMINREKKGTPIFTNRLIDVQSKLEQTEMANSNL